MVVPRVRMRWLLPCVLLLVMSPAARAHGILQRSAPRANAVLPAPPEEVLLEFNEPVDPRFSRVEVVGPNGRSARGGSARIEARRMAVALNAAGPGVYIVQWRVLSAVDGHTARGSFLFAVGEGAAVPSAAPVQPGRPPAPLVAARWLTYLAALLLAGTVLFDALIFQWTLPRADPVLAAALTAPGSAGLARLRSAAGVVLLGGLLAEFSVEAAELLGGGIGAILRRDVLASLAVQTKMGWSLLLRAYAAVLLLLPASPAWRILRAAAVIWVVIVTTVVFFLGGPAALGSSHVALIVLVGSVYGLAAVIAARIVPAIADVRVPEGRWAALAAAGLLLAGFTLTSHAGGRGWALAASDWLHLAAAATWLGGLPALLIVLRATPASLRSAAGAVLVPRVSVLAGFSLLVMVLTGLVQSWTFVASLRGFVATPYGRSLLLKLALVAIVAGLGALNRFAFRPRVALGDDRALGRFRRSAAVEITLAALILLVVASLVFTPPAAVTTAQRDDSGLRYAGYAGGVLLQVRVAPGEPGLNEIEVTGGEAAAVRLRHLVRAPDVEVALGRTGDGRRVGTVELRPGWWEIAVASAQGEATFPLLLGPPPEGTDPDAARLLSRAERTMRRVRSWREEDQITDALGHAVQTLLEAVRPDRLRYRTSSGSEAVILGAERFARERGGAWTHDRLPQTIALDGPYAQYLEGPRAVRWGREQPCGADTCRIVLWTLPSGNASFAAWIEVRSGRIYRVAMVAPEHYMTSRTFDLDAPLRITPPR